MSEPKEVYRERAAGMVVMAETGGYAPLVQVEVSTGMVATTLNLDPGEARLLGAALMAASRAVELADA